MNLVFGDTQVIVYIARNIPHIITNEHECNCNKCRYSGDIEGYECSECGNEESSVSEFGKKGSYKCPKCLIELLSTEEYRWNLQNKKQIYNPVNK